MRIKRLWLIGLALILTFIHIPATSTPTQAQTDADDENDAPYIYYYSDRYEAFVIERADGTDRYLLGQNLVDTSQLTYPSMFTYSLGDWSASGDWLAWQTHSYREVEANDRPFVMNIDGQRQVEWLADYSWADIEWSPTEDVFLMVGQTSSGYNWQHYYTVNIILADAETGGVFSSLHNVVIPNDYSETQVIRQDWILNGQYAVVEFKWSFDSQSKIIYLLDTAGHMAYWRFENVLESGRYTFDDYRNNPIEQSFSERGEIAYLDENHHLVIHNFLTNTARQFDVELNLDADIRWSPDGNYAFIYDHSAKSFWLYNSVNGTLNLLSPTVAYLRFDSYLRREPIWSPDITSAVFPMNQGMYQVDLVSGQLIDLGLPIMDGYAVDWRWLNNNRIAISIAFYGPDPTNLIYFINLNSDGYTQVISLSKYSHVNYGAFDITQDEETIYFIYGSPVAYNLQERKYQFYRPDTRTRMANWHGEVYLNKDNEEWLISHEGSCVAGGCSDGNRVPSILNVKTGYKRDLPYFKWLPIQDNGVVE